MYAKTDSHIYKKDDAGNVDRLSTAKSATAIAVAMAVALG